MSVKPGRGAFFVHFENTSLTSYQIGHMVKKGSRCLDYRHNDDPSYFIALKLGRRRRHLYVGILMTTSRAWVDGVPQRSNCTLGRTV